MFHYEDATLGPHGHLIDQDTGETINFHDADLEAAIMRAATQLGYRVVSRVLVLTGRPFAAGVATDHTKL